MNKPQYQLTAVSQSLQPSLRVVFALKSWDGIQFKLDVQDVARNPLILGALSKKDVQRVMYFAQLVAKETLKQEGK